MSRVFITEYVGLATRLEALTMAFVISDYFGHEVCIDWKELDALNIVGATVRSRGLIGRLDSLKILGDASNTFHRIPKHRNVNLRTHCGPRHLLDKYYLPTARRVKLRPDLIETIRNTFARYEQRPLVGVHIRRGDFTVVSENEFDINAATWHSAPDWWYEHVMAQIQRAVPDVAFFVSCSGNLEEFTTLRRNFDVFDIPATAPVGYKKGGHESHRHPAADLFALACCRTLIGSTCSTFSHYAANMLGERTTVLVPPAHRIARAQPELCKVDLYGRGADDWWSACRTGRGLEVVTDAGALPVTAGASVDWM
jgi:hypothetical protein